MPLGTESELQRRGFSSQPAQEAGGIAGYNAAWRDVTRDDRSGTNHRPFTLVHALQDDGLRANPDVVRHDHRMGRHAGFPSATRSQVMKVRIHDEGAVTDQAVLPECNAAHGDEGYVVVEDRAVTDRNTRLRGVRLEEDFAGSRSRCEPMSESHAVPDSKAACADRPDWNLKGHAPPRRKPTSCSAEQEPLAEPDALEPMQQRHV